MSLSRTIKALREEGFQDTGKIKEEFERAGCWPEQI